MNIDDNYHKKQELAKSIWHIIKDKTQASYTDIEHNEIDKKAELLGLKKHEIIEIKNEQQNKLIAFIEAEERRKEEEKIENLQKVEEIPPIKMIEDTVLPIGEITETIVTEPKPKKSYLYPILGILGVILLVVVGIFILGKKSKPYSNSENQTIVLGNTANSPKFQEIPFQELIGKYEGKINGKVIKIEITLKAGKKEYNYSENSKTVPRPLHYSENPNEINFSRALDKDLEKCKIFKEGSTIILRSDKDNVELRKIK